MAALTFIEPHKPEGRRQKALDIITSNPNYIEKLSALMLTDGPYDQAAHTAEGALNVVAGLKDPSDELVPSVVTAGNDIIGRIKRFNKTTSEEDPSYLGAADIDIRFTAWRRAAGNLQVLARHDFNAQLQEIVELAQIREESVSLQSVVRVGSFHLKEWSKQLNE